MTTDQTVWKAMKTVDSYQGGHELHKIAKQRVLEKSDISGVKCLKDKNGLVKVSLNN